MIISYFHRIISTINALRNKLNVALQSHVVISLPMRITLAILAGLLVVVVSSIRREQGYVWTSGDLSIAACGARNLNNPYGQTCLTYDSEGRLWPANPLTTSLILWPTVFLPDEILGLLWIAIMAGLLTFALLTTGELWRLLMLLSLPFWENAYWINWSAFVVAAWWLPWLRPFALSAKPHIAVSLLLSSEKRWRTIIIASSIGFLSLIIRPVWPFEWIKTIGNYSGQIALLGLPGLFIPFAIFRWRRRQAITFLFLSILPLRGLYDQLLLFIIPEKPYEMLWMVLLSWLIMLCGLDMSLLWLAILPIVLVKEPFINRRGASENPFPHS